MNWREPLGIRGTRHAGRRYLVTAWFVPLKGPEPTKIATASRFFEAHRVGADYLSMLDQPYAKELYREMPRTERWTTPGALGRGVASCSPFPSASAAKYLVGKP